MPRHNKTQLSYQEFRKILVMSLAGFGDAIMATPLCRALRNRYPEAEIVALTMWKSSASVFRHLDTFDSVIQHNFFTASKWSSLKLALQLRKHQFDLSVLTYPANRSHYNVLARLINARHRLGHEYLAGGSFAYGRFLLTHRVLQHPKTHNVIENLRLGQILGADVDNLKMSVGILGLDQANVDQLLTSKSRPFFGCHPGCSPLKNHVMRRWPAEKFAQLSHELAQQTGGTVFVFLGPDETNLAETFTSLAPSATLVMHTPIERTAALVRHCDVFVTSDGSLGHLAAACEVPVVSIYGPTDPEATRPFGVSHKIVSLQMDCSPCFMLSRHSLRCREGKDYACIRKIPIEIVAKRVFALMANASRHTSDNIYHSISGHSQEQAVRKTNSLLSL